MNRLWAIGGERGTKGDGKIGERKGGIETGKGDRKKMERGEIQTGRGRKTGKISVMLSGATEELSAVEPLRSERLQLSCLYWSKKGSDPIVKKCFFLQVCQVKTTSLCSSVCPSVAPKPAREICNILN